MEAFDLETCSFIVKLWLEEIEAETGQLKWRGHITHVASGKRQYVEELGAVTAFIALYLEQMRPTRTDQI